jgi:HK97 gp10 family phage protein
MAVVNYKLPDEILEKMTKLGEKSDEVIKKVLQEGAEPLYDVAKQNLKDSIGRDTKQESRSNGNWSIKVGCEGIDSKGVSNALKASVLEHGKSNQVARPWLKPSGSKAKKACIEKMKEVFEAEVDKL